MPHPTRHRAEVRQKIIDGARRLFNRQGFDGTSISQIMNGAGLTHGGFYAYFTSKSELYVEVMSCFFTDPDWKHRWEGVEVDLSGNDAGAQIVNAYLSRQHFESVENSCPMIALPTDVARSGPRTKRAFETVFRATEGVLERSLAGRRRDGEARAAAIASLCIGGMVVARALEERAHADALRNACLQVALRLGGWSAQRRRTASPRPHTRRRSTSSRPRR